MSTADTDPRPVLTPALRIMLPLAAGVILLGGLWLARDLVGPLAIGGVIVIICYPLGGMLRRRGAPRWAAAAVVILLAYLVLAVLAGLLTFAIMQFIGLVGDLVPDFVKMTEQVNAWIAGLGLGEDIASQVTGLFNVDNLIAIATTLSSSVANAGMAFFFILAYVIFMSIDAVRYGLAETALGESIRPTMSRIRAYCSGVRRYFVVNASFGVIVAVVDGIALALLDVPAPMVWAILSFVTNFVPNIGFVLGLVPPAMIALVANGWPTALIVVVVYIVANVTLQVLIQPKFISDAVGLSLTLSFFSVVFWTLVVGPLGAILSIPLTLLVRALLLENDPDRRALRWFSGDNSVADDPGGGAKAASDAESPDDADTDGQTVADADSTGH